MRGVVITTKNIIHLVASPAPVGWLRGSTTVQITVFSSTSTSGRVTVHLCEKKFCNISPVPLVTALKISASCSKDAYTEVFDQPRLCHFEKACDIAQVLETVEDKDMLFVWFPVFGVGAFGKLRVDDLLNFDVVVALKAVA